jgi:hypothetical protein
LVLLADEAHNAWGGELIGKKWVKKMLSERDSLRKGRA